MALVLDLKTKALELSTYIIAVSFLDEDGTPVSPNTLIWTLTDSAGNVINSKENVSVFGLATVVDIVLSGSDLRTTTTGETRILTVRATYDSDAGMNLPLNAEVSFAIKNLLKVTSLS